jgi:hypothetical protein
VDTLAFMTLDKNFLKKNLEKIEKYFPTELDKSGGFKESASGGDGAMSGYDLSIGTISESFCKASLGPDLNDEHKICFLQEFGTKSNVIVGIKHFTYSVTLTYSLTYLLTHSLTYLLLTHSLTCLLSNMIR